MYRRHLRLGMDSLPSHGAESGGPAIFTDSSDTAPAVIGESPTMTLEEEHRVWLQRQQEQQRQKRWQKMVARIRFGGREASMDLRVGGKYKLRRKIGSGSFGQIFLAENVLTNEEVAVKLEGAVFRARG